MEIRNSEQTGPLQKNYILMLQITRDEAQTDLSGQHWDPPRRQDWNIRWYIISA